MCSSDLFHRSLKAEVLSAQPFETLEHAARDLARWRAVYNTERPHQALAMATPADRYQPSPRSYRPTVEPFPYADDDLLRRVQHGGHVSFKGRPLKIPKAFAGKTIAFRPTTTDGLFDIVFRTQLINSLDLR